MGKSLHFTGDRRLIQKAKDKKVAKYKIYSQYKKALRDEESGRAPTAVNASHSGASDGTGASSDMPYTSAAAELAAAYSNAAPRKKKTKKKGSSFDSARKKGEEEEAARQVERDAAAAAKAQRLDEIAAAKKRRHLQQKQLSKRTKRGQPVLGNQVELYLAKLQGK